MPDGRRADWVPLSSSDGHDGEQLFAAVCSITMTKRRRFFWCVWSSGPPTRIPFKKPDVSDGGASTYEDALRDATKRAGVTSLVIIDPLWARAWIRILRGDEVWPSKSSREPRAAPATSPPASASSTTNESIWSLLGVTNEVSEADLKAAYRKRAIETHPDQGGDEDVFRRVLAAYAEAKKRLRRPKPNPISKSKPNRG